MEEDILELLPQERNKRITKRPIAWLYDIEFDDDIMEPKYYREDMDIFRNASANDTIRVRINSAGGYLHTAIQYVTNMTATEAETVAVLEGEAHSGASMVFLAADQHMVSPHAAMLIHEPRGGMYDSSAKLHAQADFNRPYIKALYHDYYKHFLSEKEIDDVLAGKDIWLNAESIVERLQYRNQQRALEEAHEYDEDCPEFDEDSYIEGKIEHWARQFSKKTLAQYADRWKLGYTSKTSRKKMMELFYEKQDQIGTDFSGIIEDLKAIENKI